MTSLSPSTDFMNNNLCSDITRLTDETPIVDGVTDVQVVADLGEDLKETNEVTMVEFQVNIPVNPDMHDATNKRLSDVYITLPMEPVVKYSMNYICRLCASVIDSSSAVNIFPGDEFQDNLACKINKYLPIVVYDTDPFPKTVCKLCVVKLNEFHYLFEKCVSVEEELRQNYVFDERYLEEMNKKLKRPDSCKGDQQLYAMPEFQYLDNMEVDQVDCDNDDINEKKKELETNICRFCQCHITDLADALCHWDRHFSESVVDGLVCLLCDRSCESKLSFEKHVVTHFGEEAKDGCANLQERCLKKGKTMRCRKCKDILNGADAALEHCERHKPSNVKYYPCVLCDSGVGKAKLREHVEVHYPTGKLSCDNCNNLYSDEKTLKYHRCTQLRKFKCTQCSHGFKSEDRLKFHEEFHRKKSTFCDICKKDFKFESRFYLHFAGVHNGVHEKPYCCDVCGKTFTWLTLLNSHKRTHTNERPFKCTKCDARFCNKYSLAGHMPSHDDHPRMQCDKCDYRTSRKQNLINHVSRFHKEVTSSQACVRCRVCSEIFPSEHHADVEDHAARHANARAYEDVTVSKLYQCERCERCYATVDDLTRHRETHSPSDSTAFYRCRLCDTGFAKHDLLVKHRKIHAPVTSRYTDKLSVLAVISCDICGLECVDYRQLLSHKDRTNCMVKKVAGTLRQRKVLIKKHLQPLKAHQLHMNASGLYECPSCQRTYKNRRRYRLHLATHSSTAQVQK